MFEDSSESQTEPRPQVVRPRNGQDAPHHSRIRARITQDDRKLFSILLMMITTPWLCLLMVTAGPPSVRLLLSLLQATAE
jgi:hypothetical protein